jgi:hypothetical protein
MLDQKPPPPDFWERHPILAQVYDDASELSKQQIILIFDRAQSALLTPAAIVDEHRKVGFSLDAIASG